MLFESKPDVPGLTSAKIYSFSASCHICLCLVYLIIFQISYLFVLLIFLITSKKIVSQCQGKKKTKKKNPTVDTVNNHKSVFIY